MPADKNSTKKLAEEARRGQEAVKVFLETPIDADSDTWKKLRKAAKEGARAIRKYVRRTKRGGSR